MTLAIKDDMSNAIVAVENTRKVCEMLMKQPHYAKLGPDGVYAVVAKARSLEIDPIDALNGALYYVNGRVGMSTEAMAARMRAAGHSITMDERSTPTHCILRGKRSDTGDMWTTSFSIDDAKRAGIYNDRGPWGKYPDVMCYNRAMSKMFRQLTPDLSRGAGYTIEELREIPVETPAPQQEAIVEAPSVITEEQASELIAIFEQCDPAYIEKVWNTLRKPPIGIEDIAQLPAHLFERIKMAGVKNREEFLKKQEEAQEKNELEFTMEAS